MFADLLVLMLLFFVFQVVYPYTNWALVCACWDQIITIFRSFTFFQNYQYCITIKVIRVPPPYRQPRFLFSPIIPFTVRYFLTFPLDNLKYLRLPRLISHCNNHWWLLGSQKQEILQCLWFRQMLLFLFLFLCLCFSFLFLCCFKYNFIMRNFRVAFNISSLIK